MSNPDERSLDAVVASAPLAALRSAPGQRGGESKRRARIPALSHGDCTFPLFPNFILHHLSCSSQRKKNKRRLYTLEKKQVYLVAADLVTFVTLYVASHPFLPITDAVL